VSSSTGRNALAALAADPSLAQRLKTPALPVALRSAPAELPLNLLGQRADVVAARWRVEAAGREIDLARAQFYPNINLKAYVGLSSLGFSNLLKSSSEQWGLGPAINLPIFSGGRLRANLRVKTSDLDAAIESYNGVVLEAVHEAADQLASIDRCSASRASSSVPSRPPRMPTRLPCSATRPA
jgi:outer membrane protein TolC